MPLYEYRCEYCKTNTESLESYDNHVNVVHLCPHCGKELDVVPGASSFIINGYRASNGYSK